MLDLAGRPEAEESLRASALPELESLAHLLSFGAIGGGIGPGLPLFSALLRYFRTRKRSSP